MVQKPERCSRPARGDQPSTLQSLGAGLDDKATGEPHWTFQQPRSRSRRFGTARFCLEGGVGLFETNVPCIHNTRHITDIVCKIANYEEHVQTNMGKLGLMNK